MGLLSVGLLSVGLLSVGLLSVGLLSTGLLSTGLLSYTPEINVRCHVSIQFHLRADNTKQLNTNAKEKQHVHKINSNVLLKIGDFRTLFFHFHTLQWFY